MLNINNVPDYAKEHRWWVLRVVDSEYWFWGAYSDKNHASLVCHNLTDCILYDSNGVN